MSGNNISQEFPITEEEYSELDKKFGMLCQFAAWQLIKRNNRNNHTDTQEDVVQDLRISLLRAGSYYKRQTYIERCLQLCEEHAKDLFMKTVIKELQNLWNNKTRHGASRQKFGPHQEKLLYKLTKQIVPKNEAPDKNSHLKIDAKFTIYCKNITWNSMKAIGKKITREKGIRSGQVSVSEYDYLAKVY
jgi:hypothetical protein